MRAHANGKGVIPVYLSARKLKRIQDPTFGSWRNEIRKAKSAGYDGIIYLNRWEGMSQNTVMKADREKVDLDRLTDAKMRKYAPELEDSYVVFDPTQIKAVFNDGTWSRHNEDMMK